MHQSAGGAFDVLLEQCVVVSDTGRHGSEYSRQKDVHIYTKGHPYCVIYTGAAAQDALFPPPLRNSPPPLPPRALNTRTIHTICSVRVLSFDPQPAIASLAYIGVRTWGRMRFVVSICQIKVSYIRFNVFPLATARQFCACCKQMKVTGRNAADSLDTR